MKISSNKNFLFTFFLKDVIINMWKTIASIWRKVNAKSIFETIPYDDP